MTGVGLKAIAIATCFYASTRKAEQMDFRHLAPVSIFIQHSQSHAIARQQVISDQTFLELDEFRRFRHVVRSLYAYKLDPKRILVLAEKLSTAGEHLMEDCQRLFVAVRQSSSLDELNLNESSIDRSLEE